jgi:hypothetical protein
MSLIQQQLDEVEGVIKSVVLISEQQRIEMLRNITILRDKIASLKSGPTSSEPQRTAETGGDPTCGWFPRPSVELPEVGAGLFPVRDRSW